MQNPKIVKTTDPKTKRLLAKHTDQWKDCELCDLHKTATNHVLVRGRLPCTVLFVGEAPGEIEDMTGAPFHPRAPAGKILQRMIDTAQETAIKRFTYAVTNILACAPWTDTNLLRPPEKSEAKACSPRLLSIFSLAQPRLVVSLGKTASKYLTSSMHDVPVLELNHPAYLARKGGLTSLEYKRCLLKLNRTIQEINHGKA